MSVEMNHEALDDAIEHMGDLAERVEQSRRRCVLANPNRGPELPSLDYSGVTGVAPQWLRDNVTDPITIVRDLARMLDTEDTGSVVWDGSTTGSIDDIKTEVGRQLADRLDDPADIDDPEDLDRYLASLEMLERYADDPEVTTAFATELGPEGVANVLNQAATLTGQYSNFPNTMDMYEDSSYGEQYERVIAMQDTLGDTLSTVLGTASREGDLAESFGRDMVEQGGPQAASILFDYGARGGVEFGTDFLTDAGDALLDWENGQGGMYWTAFPQNNQFGTSDSEAQRDPVVQWMEALPHNVEASQETMLDEGRASYLIERTSPTEDDWGTAAGDVLQTATIDQALNDDSTGQNAATISAWAIDHYGGEAEPSDGVKEELGGIVATYIRDVDGSLASGADLPPGTYGPGEAPSGLLQADGFPPYGIEIDRDALRGTLSDIGDNDSALSIVSGAANRFNDARLAVAIEENAGSEETGSDSVMYNAVRQNGGLNGFVLDNMLEGGISAARDDEEMRQRIAELALAPTEGLKAVGGPVGSYVVDQITGEVTDAFVGTGVADSIDGSNDVFETMTETSQQQALQAMVNSDGVPTGELANIWPTSHGSPVDAADLDPAEWRNILNEVRGGGYGQASAAVNAINDGQDDFLSQYGGS